jgi:hypothetical protein
VRDSYTKREEGGFGGGGVGVGWGGGGEELQSQDQHLPPHPFVETLFMSGAEASPNP